MGRPSDYTQEMASIICERLADGESLRQICTGESMPNKSTVFRWLASNELFRDQYARAREAQAEGYADEIVAIADLGEVERIRIQVDARKWIASKLLAKKYGDKMQHTGADGEGPVQFTLTRVGQKEKP
jgi:hypothetical protein